MKTEIFENLTAFSMWKTWHICNDIMTVIVKYFLCNCMQQQNTITFYDWNKQPEQTVSSSRPTDNGPIQYYSTLLSTCLRQDQHLHIVNADILCFVFLYIVM